MKASFRPIPTIGGPINEWAPEEKIAYWLNREGLVPPLAMQLDEKVTSALGTAGLRRVSDEFLRYLGALVDSWLESGNTEKGYSPPERKLKPGVLVNGVPAWGLVDTYLRTHGLEIMISSAGRISLTDYHPDSFRPEDPLRSAREYALYWFIHALQFDSFTRLAKCSSCGCYFSYERTPKRIIKSGIFCPEHRNQAGAVRSASSRDSRRDDLISVAAHWWPQWTEKKKSPRAKWIIGKVNEWIGDRFEHKKPRWVTENQKEIEAEVARRTHAES